MLFGVHALKTGGSHNNINISDRIHNGVHALKTGGSHNPRLARVEHFRNVKALKTGVAQQVVEFPTP